MSKSKRRSRRSQNNKPLMIVLGGIGLILVALFAVWKAGQSQTPKVAIEVEGSPSLKVDQEKVDFGEVKVGEVIETSFQLSNVGDQTLQFTEKPYIEVAEGC